MFIGAQVECVCSGLSKTQTLGSSGIGRKGPALEVGGFWQINGTISKFMNHRKQWGWDTSPDLCVSTARQDPAQSL